MRCSTAQDLVTGKHIVKSRVEDKEHRANCRVHNVGLCRRCFRPIDHVPAFHVVQFGPRYFPEYWYATVQAFLHFDATESDETFPMNSPSYSYQYYFLENVSAKMADISGAWVVPLTWNRSPEGTRNRRDLNELYSALRPLKP